VKNQSNGCMQRATQIADCIARKVVRELDKLHEERRTEFYALLVECDKRLPEYLAKKSGKK